MGMMPQSRASLNPEIQAWLERRAAIEGVSIDEIMSRAIALLRQREESAELLLNATRKIWTEGDGLLYQKRLREEWLG